MDPAAVAQANQQLWANHSELGGRQLTDGPEDAAYRQEWMKLYHQAQQGTSQPPAPQVTPDAAPPPEAGDSASPVTDCPAPPPPSCQIDVRAVKLSPLGYYHMFIVFTDGSGNQFFFRGGPTGKGPASTLGLVSELSGGSSRSSSSESSNSASGSSDSGSSQSQTGSDSSASSDSSDDGGSYGYIRIVYGEYAAGTIDWDPGAKSVTVESGPATCGKYDGLKKAFDAIAASKTPYHPLGPNSNSCVFTALKQVGIAPQAPDGVWVPGADVPIR
jgi:hypothetical protein